LITHYSREKKGGIRNTGERGISTMEHQGGRRSSTKLKRRVAGLRGSWRKSDRASGKV